LYVSENKDTLLMDREIVNNLLKTHKLFTTILKRHMFQR